MGRGDAAGGSDDGDRLLAALEEAETARLIAAVPDALGQYSFSHALIREALYEALPASRRMRLHRRAGEALEALAGADVEPRLEQLAHHFLARACATLHRKILDRYFLAVAADAEWQVICSRTGLGEVLGSGRHAQHRSADLVGRNHAAFRIVRDKYPHGNGVNEGFEFLHARD